MSRSNVSSRPISPLVLGVGQGAEHCQLGAGRESVTGTRKMRSRMSSFTILASYLHLYLYFQYRSWVGRVTSS